MDNAPQTEPYKIVPWKDRFVIMSNGWRHPGRCPRLWVQNQRESIQGGVVEVQGREEKSGQQQGLVPQVA